jgi:predicted component of type VI protein secretion system
VDGTLQFLPGRLEIVEGRDLGQEIRFVKQPGQQATEVTFGRQDGVAYRHVQLHEPTVSRLHARMTWEDQQWRVTNLSRTNPMAVNGTLLAPDNGSVTLKDGDRIEMGEVVFRYRSK